MINIQELQLNSGMLSMGALLGTSGHQTLINQINSRTGASSYFGSSTDPFRTGYSNFIAQVIEPIREAQHIYSATTSALMNIADCHAVTSVADLKKGIPGKLRLPVLYHPKIRSLLEEERIDGFGIDPLTLCDEDPYENLLNNGSVEFSSDTLTSKGEVEFRWEYRSTDPDLTEPEIETIRATREFIDKFYEDEETAHLDFTSYPDLHV